MYFMQRLCPGDNTVTMQARHALFYMVSHPNMAASDFLVPAQHILMFACPRELEAWHARQPDAGDLEKARGNKVFIWEQAEIARAISRPVPEICLIPVEYGTPERKALDIADMKGFMELKIKFGKFNHLKDNSFLGVGMRELTHYSVVPPIPEVHWCGRYSKRARPPQLIAEASASSAANTASKKDADDARSARAARRGLRLFTDVFLVLEENLVDGFLEAVGLGHGVILCTMGVWDFWSCGVIYMYR